MYTTLSIFEVYHWALTTYSVLLQGQVSSLGEAFQRLNLSIGDHKMRYIDTAYLTHKNQASRLNHPRSKNNILASVLDTIYYCQNLKQ
jgi:hypothetical protein